MKQTDRDALLAGLSLEQKTGQMFMGNICGGESLDVARRRLEEFHFGGLQFSGVFERFVRGGDYLPCGVCENVPLEQVAVFLRDIKKAALDITGIPVIIGGDQEGGISSSIFRRRHITLTPLPMGLGACSDLEEAAAIASLSAKEVKALGLDMLYGPCLDVNTNPLNPEIGARSFSDDPDIAAALGREFIRAYDEHDVVSNAKHFPGRGHGASNAHHELESIDLDRDRLERVELVPFREAIAAGVDSIMVGHTRYPAIDGSGLPASLSPAIISGLLREELGFEGVVLPDTLTMFAISRNYDVPEACVMCLEAGADMIFMKAPDLYRPVTEAIKAAVQSGRLSEERIDDSVRRILDLKIRRGLFDPPARDAGDVEHIVGCGEHADTAARVAKKALAALQMDEGVLPLGRSKALLTVVPRDRNVVLASDKKMSHSMLPDALGRFFDEVETVIVDESPTRIQSYEVEGRAKNADAVVFGIYSSGLSDEQSQLLELLTGMGKDVVVVVTGSPYAALRLPRAVRDVVFTFGITPSAFDAAAGLMAGENEAGGQLPKSLSGEMTKRNFRRVRARL